VTSETAGPRTPADWERLLREEHRRGLAWTAGGVVMGAIVGGAIVFQAALYAIARLMS
jgi:hypothetical protein